MELSRYAPFVAFWLAIAAICIAGSVTNYLRQRDIQRTLQLAIERGDGPLATELATRINARKPIDPIGLMLGGGAQMAVGVGLVLLGLVINRPAPMILYPLVAIGVMVFLIGAVLFGFGRWLLRRRDAERTPL